MKKLLALSVLVALVGCAEKKPLTPEEQWHGYCKSIGNAARSIMLDRQNGIEQEKAVEHANKVEDPTTQKFVLGIIKDVYAMSDKDVKAAGEDVVREQIRQKYTEQCVATPHDGMPDYKPF